jgi:hypothetical protein
MKLLNSEAAILKALTEAVLPPGQILPGGGEGTIQRTLAGMDNVAGLGMAYRGMLWTLETYTTARHGARFSTMPLGRRVEALHELERSSSMRLLLHGLLIPLKLAYFDDPEIYKALGCQYALSPPAPEKPRWLSQMSDAATLDPDSELECDVVVVGTGAGGAAVATGLAKRGHAVLLVEEGAHFTRADFTGRPMAMMQKMYRQGGLTVAVGNTVIPIPLGKGVGGTTLINSGTCLRMPDSTLAHWREDFGLDEFTSEMLAPYYSEVEKFLEVAPSSKQALGAAGELIAKGCDALGYSHQPLPRNAPGCDGQGLCCFGCPTDAKKSTNLSYVPAALGSGAQLLTGLRIDRVLVEGDRAVGVTGMAGDRRVTVRARVVVLACGALLTPVLLLKQGLANSSGEVGRNLSIHPASAAVGIFDQPTHAWRSVPQGYSIDEFHEEGILFEGANAPLDLSGAAINALGPAYMALMERYDHSLGFGFMVKDTSRGRVRVGPRGDPLITYWLNHEDVGRLQRAFGILARVFFAAGAREVLPQLGGGFERLRNLEDVAALERASLAARQIDVTAYHPLGTCRMGLDPKTSVVDTTHEAHDVLNLYVVDGSSVPSSLGVNPQLTIMALALRAAEHIDRRLGGLAAKAAA